MSTTFSRTEGRSAASRRRSADAGTQRNAGSLFSFAVATLSLVVVFAASAAPIPLYSAMLAHIGADRSAMPLATVAYFAGTIGSILVFARLSNHVGRKPATALSLAFAAIGCLVLARMDSLAALYAGRVLQGLSCGIAAGSAGAFAVDNGKGLPSWLPVLATASGPQIGLTLGSLTAAWAADALGTLQMQFVAIAAVCLGLMAALAFCRETVRKQDGVLASLRPRVSVSHAALAVLPVCSFAFIGTWAIGGFSQAFSSTLSSLAFGAPSTLLAALVFSAYMAPSVFGAPLVSRISAPAAQRGGMTGFAVAIVALAAAVVQGNALLLIGASIAGGICQGAAYSGAMRRVLERTDEQKRAETLSAVTMISYLGAAAPNLLIGVAGQGWPVTSVVLGYAVFVALCCVFSFTGAGTQKSQSVAKAA